MKRSLFQTISAGAVLAGLLLPAPINGAGAPPTLFFVNPADGTDNVSRQTQIMFMFSAEMAPTQSIAWSSNVDAARFNYTWMSEAVLMATYTGGLPGDATITWALNPAAGNPSNFRDVDGNELPVGVYSGSFSTEAGGDPNDPCNPGTDDGKGYGVVSKQVTYVQTGDAAPVLDAEDPAIFLATFRASTNHNVTSVTVSGPGGNTPLMNLFGTYLATEQFATPAALEAEFPAGNYTINATGAGSATIALGTTATVPVPKINNLVALGQMNVTSPFTLNFAPFTGAGANDTISIQISGDEGDGEFYAPDLCVPRELPNSATSVVIPANTFKTGERYSGSITFSRTANSTSIPDTFVSGMIGNTTRFEFTVGGGVTPRAPMWTTVTKNPDGTLTYTISGDTGLNVAIEGSDSPAAGWTQLTTAALTTGSFQYTVNPATPRMRFYRARVI